MALDLDPQRITIPVQMVHQEDLEGLIGLPDRAESMVILVQMNTNAWQRLINDWVSGRLNRRGIATLVLDLLPRNGQNSNGTRFHPEAMAQRLELVTKWLLRQQATKFLTMGYFGTSIGAAATLIAAAALGDKVAAVVAAGGRPDLACGRLAQVSAATLLVVGERDELAIELNREALEEISSEKQLVIIPEATYLFKQHGAFTRIGEIAVDWFERHLRKHADAGLLSSTG